MQLPCQDVKLDSSWYRYNFQFSMQNVVYFNRWLIYSICVFEANNTYNLASSY